MLEGAKWIFATAIGIAVLTATIVSLLAPPETQQTTEKAQVLAPGEQLTETVVATHAAPADCWMIIDNAVYDVTSYVNSHPGGPVITQGCGTDATELFRTKGSNKAHSEFAHQLLQTFLIGKLGSTAPSTSDPSALPDSLESFLKTLPKNAVGKYQMLITNASGTFTATYENGVLTVVAGNQLTADAQVTKANSCVGAADAAKHNRQSDCWILIGSTYYDVTRYIPQHPGGAAVITPYCGGKDATSAFATKGGTGGVHSAFAKQTLQTFSVADACADVTRSLSAQITTPSANQQFVAGTKSVRLSVSTTQDATCRHGNRDQAFSAMSSSLRTTDKRTHTADLSASDGKTYTEYVRCQDSSGTAMTSSESVTFSIALPLAANLTLTTTEVAKHNKQSDCWIIINNKVYDVTSYIPLHPGGATVIASRCGTDATTAFETKGGTGGVHSATAKNLLAGYLLGTLENPQPPQATITLPTANQQFAAGTAQITLAVTTDKAATCKYSNTDAAYSAMSGTFSTTGGTSHSTTLTGLVTGQSYTTYVRCQDSSGTAMTSSASVSYTITTIVDNTPPTATITAPTANQQLTASTTSTTLSVTTNEAASCRWHTSDVAYASMTNTFSTTGGTSHSTAVSGLASGQTYTRYVRCQDPVGNNMTSSASVTFSVAALSAYTLSQIASHNSQSSCWLAISGEVYDVTTYIAVHPGGTAVIVTNCGTDATAAFATKGGTGGVHSATAINLLATFRIGSLTDTTPPTATITTPIANQQFTAGTTQTTLSVTTTEAATCKYSSSDVPYGSMTSTLSTTGGTSHSVSITGLTDGGSYTRYVRCQDTAGNAMTSSATVTFTVSLVADTTPPTATITAPAANQQFNPGTTQTTLSVTTTEAATCKVHTSDTAYAAMGTTFAATGGTTHSTTISGLTNGGTYTRYVRCQDTAGNAMTTSRSVTFSVGATSAYTLAQVAQHNSQSSCWLAISGNVYDVTNYLSIHPGGVNAIVINCGTDATTAFNTKNGLGTHSNTAKNLLATYLIGTITTTDSTPPIATITAPAQGQQLGGGTTSTSLAVSTDETATCRYSTTDQQYSSMSAFSSTNSKTHSTTINGLANGGAYTYYVRCQDTAGNAMTSSASVQFSVSTVADTTPPTATITAPTANQQLLYTTTSATLTVTTDEPATCKFGPSDTTYANLPTVFSTTGTTSHSTTLSPLVSGQSYTYYVRCQDTASPPNTMSNSASVTFSVALPPSYSMAQVAQHSSLSSCWIVVQTGINNGVFDMTSFANTHPGGRQAIQINCGKNATRTFNVQDGHGTAERNALNGFWIGFVS